MTLFEHRINNQNYTFVCDSWSNYNSWGHSCSLMRGLDNEIGNHRIKYYNRTWEAYQYQSIMESLIRKLIEEEEAWQKEEYKRRNNIGRMTAKKQGEFEEELKKSSFYNELLALKKEIK